MCHPSVIPLNTAHNVCQIADQDDREPCFTLIMRPYPVCYLHGMLATVLHASTNSQARIYAEAVLACPVAGQRLDSNARSSSQILMSYRAAQ